jgi:hypothetical protein
MDDLDRKSLLLSAKRHPILAKIMVGEDGFRLVIRAESGRVSHIGLPPSMEDAILSSIE